MGTKLSPVGSSASGGSITPFIVVVGDDPAANGQALLDAYATAVASTPNGLALAEDNRAVVVCPPALYEMPATLVLASPYVDIVGLTDDVASQVLVPSATATDGAVQGHGHGDGAKFYNLTFRANGGDEITGFTFPNSLANSYFQNCVWVNVDDAYGMETAVVIRSTFDDCVGGIGSFGGNGGSFSGTATNCTGGSDSFGVVAGSFSSTGRAAYCRLTSGSFPTPATGGIIVLCIDGSWTEVNDAP